MVAAHCPNCRVGTAASGCPASRASSQEVPRCRVRKPRGHRVREAPSHDTATGTGGRRPAPSGVPSITDTAITDTTVAGATITGAPHRRHNPLRPRTSTRRRSSGRSPTCRRWCWPRSSAFPSPPSPTASWRWSARSRLPVRRPADRWCWTARPRRGGRCPGWCSCGLLTALTIRYLPGNAGHSPAFGFKTGGGPPSGPELIGIFLAALTTLSLGAVLGPEAPLIAIGGGLAR